jgi:signal peptidase II
MELGQSIHAFGPVHIVRVANSGSVFGLGQGYVLVPTIASVVILVAIPVVLGRARARYGYVPDQIEAVCLALVGGGAIGNLIDRIVFGSVTDFVDVELLFGVHWPVFNLADSCIVVGTLALLFFLYRRGVFDGTVDGTR